MSDPSEENPPCTLLQYSNHAFAVKGLQLLPPSNDPHARPRVYFHKACGFWHATNAPRKRGKNSTFNYQQRRKERLANLSNLKLGVQVMPEQPKECDGT